MQARTAWEQVLLVTAEKTSSVFVWQEPVKNEVYLLLGIGAIDVLVVKPEVLDLFVEESLELLILDDRNNVWIVA